MATRASFGVAVTGAKVSRSFRLGFMSISTRTLAEGFAFLEARCSDPLTATSSLALRFAWRSGRFKISPLLGVFEHPFRRKAPKLRLMMRGCIFVRISKQSVVANDSNDVLLFSYEEIP